MVHGDDFTALGTDEALDRCEDGLKKPFECKIRGRLGLDKEDMKEIRVLNRILRITDEGLLYEADPRHVELLAKSMGLDGCKPVATPGLKQPFEDKVMDLPVSDEEIPISPMTPRPPSRKVHFSNDEPDTFFIKAYSEIYGQDPSQFVFGLNGKKILLDAKYDSYTGVLKSEIVARKTCFSYDDIVRAATLRKCMLDGSAWEPTTAEIIAKISPKAKYKMKRIGAKAAKAAERFESKGEILDGDEATTFRALAARANYLSLDRPECAYATKELCRFFATPTKTGVEQLKRLVRYLVGAPRLVWNFKFQDPTDEMVTYVDTDFGGCHVTRRSTSGGAATRGNHLVKHWSQTQPTVALSSAEAELSGICKGAAQSLGLQSLAADLGINLKLTIMSDATAAIGIARRRGLGKVRHLATADLWIQDRLRKKDFALAKILGADNPSDMLTKHVDRMLLSKHMRTLGLSYEGGRAESAPSIDH